MEARKDSAPRDVCVERFLGVLLDEEDVPKVLDCSFLFSLEPTPPRIGIAFLGLREYWRDRHEKEYEA